MRIARVVGVIAVNLSTFAAAQTDPCQGSVIKDFTRISVDQSTFLAVMNAIDSERSETSSEADKVGIQLKALPLNMSRDRARALSQRYSEVTNKTFNRETQFDLISSTLSANSVEAYKVCRKTLPTVGPVILVHDAKRDRATVTVRWNKGAGDRAFRTGEVEIVGGTPTTPFPKRWETGVSVVRVVIRNPTEDMTVTANIGGSDHASIPYVPVVRLSSTITVHVQPNPKAALLRVANDGTGNPDGPISDCFPPPRGEDIVEGSGTLDVVHRAGSLDKRTYAKLTENTAQRVCYKAYMHPLKLKGGDLQFRVKYQTVQWSLTAD